MLYIGIDVHKKNLQVCILDEEGKKLQNLRVANIKEIVAEYFGGLSSFASGKRGFQHVL